MAHLTWGFLNTVTAMHHNFFMSDIWNGVGGNEGWTGCGAHTATTTQCRFAVMNIKMASKDGKPLHSGGCSALNKVASESANTTIVV